MIFTAVFSVDTCVGGCGRPIYAREIHMDVSFWKFSKNTPNYASVDKAMQFLMIMHSTCTCPFSDGVSVIGVLLLDVLVNSVIHRSCYICIAII